MPQLPHLTPPIPPCPLPANRRGATVSGQRTVDEPVAATAGAQHGLVTTAQLHAIGLSDGGLRHWVRTGRLHRVHRGVYAVGHAALSQNARRMAVVLACGPGALLSHVTAAELWGLRSGSSSRWHVTAPTTSGGRGGPSGVVVHRTLDLRPEDRAVIDGVPVTSVARTIADFAVVARPVDVARVVHEAEVLRLLDVDAVLAVMERLPRRPGAARLRPLLVAADATVGREAFVRAFLRLCRRHGLPEPSVSVHLQTAERLVEADMLFADHRLVVELDSVQFHHTRRGFHSDRRRDALLAAEGYQTIRLTWDRVTREAGSVATELQRILAVRCPQTVAPRRFAGNGRSGG